MLNESQIIIGIDDAGRGPVLGPMCLAGVMMRKENEKAFAQQGIKDSKLLTPAKRESLIEYIKKNSLALHFQLITPVEIDTGFGMGLNLNQVEALAAANIINELTTKLSSEQKTTLKIILDCPSINTAGWKNQLMGYVKEKSLEKNIVCEHKADFHYPVVSAASIIAKTTRDAEIEKIKKMIGIDFGSGYPSDPYTVQFLKEHANDFKKERIFRESWSTWQNAAKGYLDKETRAKQKGLADY
jgi:ribonuclease HII